jgi:hypothetical protein
MEFADIPFALFAGSFSILSPCVLPLASETGRSRADPTTAKPCEAARKSVPAASRPVGYCPAARSLRQRSEGLFVEWSGSVSGFRRCRRQAARQFPSSGDFRSRPIDNAVSAIAALPAATMFLLFVKKTRQALTFFATIELNHWGHEDVGDYFDSGAAHDFRGGLYRSASDKRSPGHPKRELRSAFEAGLCFWGRQTRFRLINFLDL